MERKMIIKQILSTLKNNIMLSINRYRLCKKYPNSVFYPGCLVDDKSKLGKYNVIFNNTIITSSVIGDHSYIQKNSNINNTNIGKFCSIAAGVNVGLSQHSMSCVSSHPAFYLLNTPLAKTFSSMDKFVTSKLTTIGHDVWIGQNVLIMNGVNIGNGAVIAAGAVVTKDVENYAIVGGVPAKFIRFRFDEKIREGLNETKWWDLPDEWLAENVSSFFDPVKIIELIKKYK